MKSSFYLSLFCFLAFSAAACSTSSHTVQEKRTSPALSEFEFVLKTSESGVALTCKRGCQWEQLTFNLASLNHPQVVSSAGMISLQKHSDTEKSDHSGFEFTMVRTDEGVSMTDANGSAWKSLSFSCSDPGCRQTIDQYGMN